MGCDNTLSLQTVVALGSPPSPSDCPLEPLSERVISAASPEETLRATRETHPDLVVVRESVPKDEGLALLKQLREVLPETPVVVLSDRPDVDAAVTYMRHGARDYVSVPMADQEVTRLLTVARTGASGRHRQQYFAPECPSEVPLVGHAEGTRTVLRMLRLVAESACNPVLITGETGTGKELAAHAVHALRGGTPETFVAVNCAALTATLLESELFGHVKGAFTGADRDKTGLFEVAGTGSLFLDEISEMPPELQAKLLRVIQERRFRKVGGTRDLDCRCTLIASSNRDLELESREGRFRRDLYYRLAVFPVELPPLRAPGRREDVPLLARYFVETSAQPARDRVRGLAPEAEARLMEHPWPGNVRELRNTIERAMILETSDRITPDSLRLPTDPDRLPVAGDKLTVPSDDFSLETAERLFITRALKETGWQRTRAAALLGITRATLHAKLKRYKIKIPDPGSPAAASRTPLRLTAAGV